VAVDRPLATERRRPPATERRREVEDIPAVVVSEAAVTPEVAVEVAGHPRATARQALAAVVAAAAAAAADRVTPAMEDTNINPDTCSLGEAISVLDRIGFHPGLRTVRSRTQDIRPSIRSDQATLKNARDLFPFEKSGSLSPSRYP
jgi:hypothetical protein